MDELRSASKAQQENSESSVRSSLKLAILLPDQIDRRVLRRAAEMAAALSEACDSTGRATEVVIGLAERDERRWREHEAVLRTRVPSLIVRHLEWTSIPVANAQRMFSDLPNTFELLGFEDILVPRDWGWNFRDCDAWISMVRSDHGPILPLRPIAHFCTGLPERYVPELIAPSIHDPLWDRQTNTFRIWRKGLVVTSDPLSVPDLMSFAGVRKERIEVIPDLLAALPAPGTSPAKRDDHLVFWLLRGNALDDLRNSLAGLDAYYREGGKLEVVVLSETHAQYASHPGYAGLPYDHQYLFQNLEHITFHNQAELERILPQAAYLWSSEQAGGESDALYDAQRAECMFLGPDLDFISDNVEELGVKASLYPPNSPTALADAFHQLEQLGSAASRANSAPKRSTDRKIAFSFLLDRIQEQIHG